MKVKVVKCSNSSYWYCKRLINKIVEVSEESNFPDSYYCSGSQNPDINFNGYILKSDCELIDCKLNNDTDFTELLKIKDQLINNKDEIIKLQKQIIQSLENQIKGL